MNMRERLTASVADIRARGQRLGQLHLELLKAELREKGKRFAAAAALFAAAGMLALYAIGFALATVVVALALVLPLWLSMLIVTLVLFLIVVVLVLVGRAKVRQIDKPEPEAAIAEARATADLMKTNIRETTDGVRARMTPWRKSAEQAPASQAVAVPPSSAPRPGSDSAPSAERPASTGTPGSAGDEASGTSSDPGATD
jgi:membrane protein implicated in regulation of membrane protease activity